MKKKTYFETPELEVIDFEDVITASNTTNEETEEEGEWENTET